MARSLKQARCSFSVRGLDSASLAAIQVYTPYFAPFIPMIVIEDSMHSTEGDPYWKEIVHPHMR